MSRSAPLQRLPPGRMGPPACTSFMALGFALMVLTGGEKKNVTPPSHLRSSVLCITRVIPDRLLAYGATAMYTIPRLTGIALQTATMLDGAEASEWLRRCPDSQPMKMLFEDSDAGILAPASRACRFGVCPFCSVGYAFKVSAPPALRSVVWHAAYAPLQRCCVLGGVVVVVRRTGLSGRAICNADARKANGNKRSQRHAFGARRVRCSFYGVGADARCFRSDRGLQLGLP